MEKMFELLEVIEKQPDNTDARMELARGYLEKQDFSSAKIRLKEVLSINPDHIDANYILGQVYEIEEDFSGALECFEKVVQHHPSFDFVYKLGQLYEQTDDYEKSLSMYKECYKATPQDQNICERMAHVNSILGNTEEAIDFYNKLLVLDPENLVSLTQLMDLYEKSENEFFYYLTKGKINELEGNLSQAISAYKKALTQAEKIEDTISIRFAIANLLIQKENYLQAVDEYLHILEHDSKNYLVYKNLAEAYTKLDNIDAATGAYEKALEIYPNDESILSELAEMYSEIEEYEKALGILDKLIKIKPNELVNYINSARAYIALNMDTKAEESLNFVLKKDPKNVEAIGVFADFLTLKQNYEKALEWSNRIKELIPKSPYGYRKAGEIYEATGMPFEAHYNFGIYHDLKGEKQLAIDEFNWALEINPDNIEIILKMAKLYEEISEEYIAIEYYQRAYSIDNQNHTVVQKMGNIYLKNKDYEQAANIFKQMIKLNENNKDAYFSLAEASENMRDYDMALENYKKVITISGTSSRADEAKARIQRIESKINGEEDEGLLNKLFKIFSR